MEMLRTRLIDRTMCGTGTATFRFERPADYTFIAGQFMTVEIACEAGEVRKPFTIASAPQDEWLELTTRLSESCFKVALAGMQPGDALRVSHPMGSLVLPPGPRPFGFLVGGVGITPAHSILRNAVLAAKEIEAVLFYGNRDDSCMPYAQEFDAMADSGVRTVHVLERPSPGWTGESGFITAGMVRRYVESPESILWISAGPPAMADAMVRVFDTLGIPAEGRMVERFTGYA